MKRMLRVFASALLTAGCAPLTFSEPAAIDFSRFRSVRVEGDMADYLAAELTKSSGFERTTTDPRLAVDLVLRVGVAVAENRDSDGNVDYTARADYRSETPAGVRVDSGSEDDTSDTPWEASEDALDEVALHYIRPYRL
jgi:hypothetical protein